MVVFTSVFQIFLPTCIYSLQTSAYPPKIGQIGEGLYRFINSQIYKIISNNRKSFLQKLLEAVI
jgi:hypothetical protein